MSVLGGTYAPRHHSADRRRRHQQPDEDARGIRTRQKADALIYAIGIGDRYTSTSTKARLPQNR
jgi:hypothetical protein